MICTWSECSYFLKFLHHQIHNISAHVLISLLQHVYKFPGPENVLDNNVGIQCRTHILHVLVYYCESEELIIV